jgi:hypothetical protein
VLFLACHCDPGGSFVPQDKFCRGKESSAHSGGCFVGQTSPFSQRHLTLLKP